MASPITPLPVCVTGASGFIASRIVADLLALGYRVRGTVRDAGRPEKYGFLTSLPGAAERLELVSADLLAPDSFDAAVAGCPYVLHTASPYSMKVRDPQRDLVDPAVEGTRAVFAACARVGGVKRVVLTSSVAAMTDAPEDGQVLTEADWNEKSSLKRNPYYYSKTLAERAGWDFVAQEQPGFDLVVINPFMVLGPSFTPALNASNEVIRDLLAGAYPGVVDLAWGFVDVRDVSRAHILAMETPSATGRYLCAAETRTMRETVAELRALGFGGYKLPKRNLDTAFGRGLLRVAALFQPPGVRSFLKTNLGRVPRFDNAKITRELGLVFRPLDTSLRDAVADLERWGHLKSPQG